VKGQTDRCREAELRYRIPKRLKHFQSGDIANVIDLKTGCKKTGWEL